MIGIDFNLSLNFGQYTFTSLLKGLANAHRTDGFLTTNRISPQKTIRQMCSQIPRQPSNKNFFLFRSIPLYGFCSDNISSEPSGHPNLSTCNAAKTLPLWHTRKYFSQYIGKCKRTSKLENLCRLRADFNKQGSRTLCQRRLWNSIGPRGICSGFNNNRFMSFTIPMGKISQTQSCDKAPHPDGLKRLYTDFYLHYGRKSPRCKYPRRSCFRARCDLHNGSRISRFCSPLYLHPKPFNFYYKSQKQFRLQPNLLSPGQQDNRPSMRPDDMAQWFLHFTGLSCCAASNRLFRHRDKSKVHISNEQFHTTCFNNRTALQVPMADRNLLQMDQTISANKNVFGHNPERGKDTNLDCYQRLYFGSNYQEGTENRVEFGRNLANSQHCTFRESSYYRSTYEKCFAKRDFSIS